MVTVFFGLSAFVVAGLVWLGLVDSWMGMIGSWVLVSAVMILGLRRLLARFIAGDQETGSVDEDEDAYGQVVEVVSINDADGSSGRIRFRGADWDAESMNGSLREGGFARIVSRANLKWMVEPYQELEE